MATRCTRIARDCNDAVVIRELEVISLELVEKAGDLDATYGVSASGGADTVIATSGERDRS